MSLFDRIRSAARALLSPDGLDANGRAAVQAIERKMASMLREQAAYRVAIGTILHRRGPAVTTKGCRVCGLETTHADGCEVGIAQRALTTAAELRAERGESEGKA